MTPRPLPLYGGGAAGSMVFSTETGDLPGVSPQFFLPSLEIRAEQQLAAGTGSLPDNIRDITANINSKL